MSQAVSIAEPAPKPLQVPDVSLAIEEFLRLTDAGLTRANVRDFLARLERDHDQEYVRQVKLRIRVFLASYDLIHEVERGSTRV